MRKNFRVWFIFKYTFQESVRSYISMSEKMIFKIRYLWKGCSISRKSLWSIKNSLRNFISCHYVKFFSQVSAQSVVSICENFIPRYVYLNRSCQGTELREDSVYRILPEAVIEMEAAGIEGFALATVLSSHGHHTPSCLRREDHHCTWLNQRNTHGLRDGSGGGAGSRSESSEASSGTAPSPTKPKTLAAILPPHRRARVDPEPRGGGSIAGQRVSTPTDTTANGNEISAANQEQKIAEN